MPNAPEDSDPASPEGTTPGWRRDQLSGLVVSPIRSGTYVPKNLRGRGAKLVNMGELFGNPQLFDIEMERVPVSEADSARFGLLSGDLLFARRSMIGTGASQCSIVREIERGSVFDSSLIRVRVDHSRVDPQFLFYFFWSPEGVAEVESIGRHGPISGITGKDLATLPVPVPALREQRAIAGILGSLDDRIELNRRMNRTLEQIAEALFKSWFVDFDPVRAKAEGRWKEGQNLPGTAAEMWDHWPSEFKESEIGKIPKGWAVRRLGDFLEVVETGSRPSGGVGDYDKGIPSLGAESVLGMGLYDFSKTKYVPEAFYAGMTRGKIDSRDVLLYKDGGRPGEYEPHVGLLGDGFPFEVFCINEHVYRLRSSIPLGQSFLYHWLTTELVKEDMRQKGTGVAVPGLNSTAVRSLPVLVPPSVLCAEFEGLSEPLVARILLNAKEAGQLARVRDTLLPKLLSGEIRVPLDGGQ